jgi:hypothetical protein
MYINKKQNPLGVRVGDTVRIFYSHTGERFVADVTSISSRIEYGNDPAIEFIRWDGVISAVGFNSCSVSHVQSVLYHTPYKVESRSQKNLFRKTSDGRAWLGYHAFGGKRVGDVSQLVKVALAAASDEMSRPLDMQKFDALWKKARFPGKVAHRMEYDYLEATVNWKVFRRFVIMNRHKICATIRELEATGKKYASQSWDEEEV